MNDMGKFSPSTAEVCETLRKLLLSKCKWTWNNTYQSLYDKAIHIQKRVQLWPSTTKKITVISGNNTLGVGLGASLSQLMWPIAFTSKSTTNAETCYSNIEREVLGILHRLENSYHYCCAVMSA